MSYKKHPQTWITCFKNWLHPKPTGQEDLRHYLTHCHEIALINHDTFTMLEGVLEFAPLRVRDILLPKTQMISLAQDATLNDIIQIVSESGHSRFPVTGETSDEIIGILHAKDILRFQTHTPPSFALHDLLRQAFFVPESKRLLTLLGELRKNRTHMAIVVDEYGAISGLVTLEDILEQIIGSIEDEFDVDDEMLIKPHGHGRYTVKGHTPIEVFNEELHTTFSELAFDTIAGIISSALGHLPKRGETLLLNGLQFKIIHADARRIQLLECIDKRQKESTPHDLQPSRD
ncbi:MAG: CBS domain-containing protein [Gammaproteobacteria bacterium]|nr:CBS domain-containing protein [Gammaproteobacteria bacterium]